MVVKTKEQTSNVPDKDASIADIFFRSKELEREGVDIIHLDVGEPDYEPPNEVVDATVKALRSGRGRYTLPEGIAEVRRSVADRANAKYGTNISAEQVLFTAGGRMALFLAFASLPKDSKIGIISPDWPAYRDLCDFMRFKTHFLYTHLEKGWEPDLEEISASGCDALVLNYPNNPTGKILNPVFFEKLVKLSENRGLKIISDEVYSDYILNKSVFKSILQTRTSAEYILATSLSKSYSMTGFRAAYLISDEATVSRLAKINSLVLTSAPEFVQYGAMAAFRSREYVEEKVKLIKERLEVACRELEKLGVDFYRSDGSLYLFPKLVPENEKEFDSQKFAHELLEKEHVSITPGSVFGKDYRNHIRITLLQDKERIREGIERISRLL